ncbi:MAG: hypothetical protein E7166_03140 [Firmicutes bacterium]|nr:hypothetical protein [Bacillota bacterium]
MLKQGIQKTFDFISELNKISLIKKSNSKNITLFYILHSTTINNNKIQFKIKMIKNNLINNNYSILIDVIYKKYKFDNIKFDEYTNFLKCWFEYKKKVKNFKTSNYISLLNELEVQIRKTLLK